MSAVLVVGASGFVGRRVVADLARRGKTVYAASRQRTELPAGAAWFPLPDLSVTPVNWPELPTKLDQIVYLAARVHVMNDMHPDPLQAYRAVNLHAPLALARIAVQRNVKRFVYLSSIKVNGEESQRPITEMDTPHPTDPYGISKWEAEQELLKFGKASGLEIVIVRPPLVYGPDVKANFMALARAAGRGVPLPIGAVQNQRSMIYVENLVDFITTTLNHPAAAGEVFLVSDDRDLSTPELTRLLAEAQGKPAHLPAVPVTVLNALGQATGRSSVIHRLTSSLRVSHEKAQNLLGWTPPYPVWQAVARTGRSLLESHSEFTLPRSRAVTAHRLNPKQRLYLKIRSPAERLLALAALLILSPFWLALALLIKLDSRGPALFIQERAGRGHQPFRIYKFRTMRTDAPHLSTEEMQRSGLNPITRVGSLLRRTSLDELPQLLNVINGEMSFVGPRPALMTQKPVLTLRERAGVQELLPGITGYAQATGRDDLTDELKVERDWHYLRNIGLPMDIKVVRLTLRSVLKGTGNK